MRRSVVFAVAALTFAAGIVTGVTAKSRVRFDPNVLQGEPAAVADRILGLAKVEGSWEEIGIARVHYLAGHKDQARAVFERYAGGRDPGDLVRIARVYAEAGEWDAARPLFDQVIAIEPEDADWLAEVGAHYNLHGDRAKAEELFARAFSVEANNLNTRMAAASYLGVRPD